ncbi:MAG: secretin N-terminal domain-containing protein [Phycisphaerales bacterium]
MSTTTNGRSGRSRVWPRRALVVLAAAGACAPLYGQDRPRATPGAGGAEGVLPMSAQPPAMPPGPGPTGAPALPPAQGPQGQPADDLITLSDFPEAVDLRALVEWVGETLKINIAANDQLTGSVVINAPITVRKDQLLELLNALLEQQGYTIYYDKQSGWYRVDQGAALPATFDDKLATTKLIPTPGLRPSSLTDVMNQQLGQQTLPAGATRPLRISYLDDLGVILLTDTPRRIATAESIVAQVIATSRAQDFNRFDLQHIAASVARQRVLELLGQATAPAPFATGGTQPPATAGAASSHAVLGLGERLSVDLQGNALILRGTPDEAARIAKALIVIDRPKVLEYRQYFAGSAASQIAEMAQRQGLGTVETIDSAPQATTGQQPGQPPPLRGGQAPQFPGAPGQQQVIGGPVMIVDTFRGVIIYYATRSQHDQLASFIKTVDAEREQVVITAYKLKNLPADDVADIIIAMITGQTSAGGGTSAFMPGGTGGRERGGTRGGGRSGTLGNQGNLGGLGGLLGNQGGFGTGGSGGGGRLSRGTGAGVAAEGESPFGSGTVFIVSDRSNNQVLVRAPAKQQEDFAKLIAKLDQRRPQVYLEVQIVAVSASDDFRLAFEVQGINAGGSGGAVNTNFGLGTLTTTTAGDPPVTTGGFLSPKNITTTLGGMTAAIIRNDQVPIVLRALKTDTDTRILSSPQLLVDDNETAEIVSVEEQPTTTSNQGTATTQVSFDGFEGAGTKLLVTPSISEGGYLRLSYDIELSNFVGTSSAAGIPPARQTRNINSDSVTIPGDTTIVVGGIKVDSKNNTIAKVPLLGDIPIVGHLFRDTNKTASNTRLYVFITPRIMRDPNFRDLLLLTRGPQAESGLAPDVPDLRPAMIEIVEPPPMAPQGAAEPRPGAEGGERTGMAPRKTHGRT